VLLAGEETNKSLSTWLIAASAAAAHRSSESEGDERERDRERERQRERETTHEEPTMDAAEGGCGLCIDGVRKSAPGRPQATGLPLAFFHNSLGICPCVATESIR
jgi:hypothetical protein